MKKEKVKKVPEVLKNKCGTECNKYGLSWRRSEATRCDRCKGKVQVSADIMLRIAEARTIIVCGACLGHPGSPEELPINKTKGIRLEA